MRGMGGGQEGFLIMINRLKVIGVVAVVVMVLNLVLFAFTIIPWQIFLFVVALGAGFAYWGLPRLKKF